MLDKGERASWTRRAQGASLGAGGHVYLNHLMCCIQVHPQSAYQMESQLSDLPSRHPNAHRVYFRGWGLRYPPPPALRKHGLVQAPERALTRCFEDFLGPLFFVVLNAGLGVCDALVEGKGGIVRSVHNNIAPRIATPWGLF